MTFEELQAAGISCNVDVKEDEASTNHASGMLVSKWLFQRKIMKRA